MVLGSLNMDIVLRVPHAPAAGETLQGRSISHIPGGKGANQAVSCAREGGRVAMLLAALLAMADQDRAHRPTHLEADAPAQAAARSHLFAHG